jgi:hypothetical protein
VSDTTYFGFELIASPNPPSSLRAPQKVSNSPYV